MRGVRMERAFASAAVFALAIGAAVPACFYNFEDDCALIYTCALGTSGPGSGTGGGVCVPSEAPGPVADGCGVFVSASGDDGSAGTKGAPVASVARAIELATAGAGRVYACAEELDEAVVMPAGITIYGGLDCSMGWAYAGESQKTILTAQANEIPLRITGGEGVARLVDVHVKARDATVAGGSSIAALAEAVSVELARCVLEAGKGADGAAGESHSDAAVGGEAGSAGEAACTASQVFGGIGATNVCGDVTSRGGDGGNGKADTGGDGSDGKPLGTLNGGAGEDASPCTAGSAGDDGAPGEPGLGGTALGALDNTGYIGVAGADGGPGKPAQGGGGGGGAKGGTGAMKCSAVAMANGASGGGGGAGGCGGAGGRGGAAGGASIALVSLDADLTFDTVTLKSSDGGRGGAGGPGQSGGAGGMGGPGGSVGAANGLNAGCTGGPGGIGGTGGQGGGGRGGHSIGVAFKGATLSLAGATIEFGAGGKGGLGSDAAGSGADGAAQETQTFL